jgi:sporulation protein YlmC with PRC-barrel domain
MEVSVDSFRGRKVFDITGNVLGTVGHLMVDTETWAIGSFELRLRRRPAQEVGMRWSIFRVPVLEIPTGLVMAAGDAIILRAALYDLQPLAPEHRRPLREPDMEAQAAH